MAVEPEHVLPQQHVTRLARIEEGSPGNPVEDQ